MTIDEYIEGLRNKIPYALILTDSDFRRSTDFYKHSRFKVHDA